MFKKERPADIAIRLASTLGRAKERVRATGEVDRKNPFALALYVIAVTVEAVIMNGKTLEFAEHCFEFTARQAGREVPNLALHTPDEPSLN